MLNLDFLENFSYEKDINEINNLFNNLLIELEKYLKLEPIYQNIKIVYNKTEQVKKEEENYIFSLGVRRYFENESLIIEIFKNYEKFIPIILLREAYNCFIPKDLLKNDIVQVVIHQITINNLSKFNFIDEWKSLINNNIVSYDFLITELDRLSKFLKLKGTVQFIFEFIRRNIPLIIEGMDNFYDKIYDEHKFKISKSMNDDEIIETLRVLIKIFYMVESYNALSLLQNHFKEMKSSGKIQSDLSLRRFSENMKWINHYTYISPSYQINWRALNVVSVVFNLKFNPHVKRVNIYKFINQFPFLFAPKYSKNKFAVEVSGYILIPIAYLNDFLKLLEKLHQFGYIINKQCYAFRKYFNFLNLNYFRGFHNSQKKFINLNHEEYDKKYEFEFDIDYEPSFYESKLSILDWIIFGRISNISVTGFTFDRRNETLNYLKSDLINEILSQRALIKDIHDNLTKINSSLELKKEIIQFLNKYRKFGFFYVKETLNDLLICLDLVEKFLSENPSISNNSQLLRFINNSNISQSIEENILIKKYSNTLNFKKITLLYFQSKEEYRNEINKFQLIHSLFKSCSDLKIFNIKKMGEIIRKPNIIEKIFKTKAEKLEISYQKYKPYQITNQLIDDKLEDFLKNDPPIIKPLLINNVITEVFSRLFLIVFLKDTAETRIKLDQIKVYFPRILIIQIEDLHTKRKFIYLHGYFPNIKEKEMLISILVNTFKDDLIILKRSFLTRKVFLLKSFYDFQNKRFFYTKDLFDQYFLYCQKIFGREITSLQEIQGINQEAFWSKEKEMSNLINEIDHNLLKSNIDLNINKLNKLITFNSNLREILLDREKFKDEKLKYFFKNYVKSIKFIPKFQQFGIGQYFMYIYPNNLNEIDLTLLLSNSFQKVKYPASIDNSTSLFIRYLWPYRNPNLTYVRWLTKSKKNIREYCLFFIKKIKTILNINYNLSLNNWVYDPNKFKIFMQNILFNPIYKIQISKTKEFNIGNLVNSDYRGPESDDFINLIKIYNWHSIDIKSYLLTKKLTIINPIVDLLEENLIFPYISLKNLDLIEKIYIILPNLKQDLNNKIQQIFSFFNFGFIYEIEGEYFIYGMPEEIKFEDGLMIELSLPDCDLNGFIKLFELLFHYLEIEHYLILYDLLDGKNLLESIYGNLNFLKDYNPLKNLRWNSKDKIWMNNKLFNEKFEPIYHDLIPEEKD